MTTHKAILIDAKARTFSIVEVGDCLDIQKKIGCGCFTIATQLPRNDVIYVDDEGMLTLDDESVFFEFEGAHQPFVGNGLVMGGDDEGETQDVKITLLEIQNKVKFLTLAQVRTQSRQEDFA